MNGIRKLSVNLASRPKRNRRFFRLAVGTLVVLAALVGWLGLGSFIGYKSAQSEASAETTRLESVRIRQDRLRAEREAETLQLRARLKDKVEIINQALVLKGFSWVEFFDLLEEALPASCYISSMAPVSSVDGRLEVRFKVVSVGLTDTLQFLQRLAAAAGSLPRVQNELKSGGQTVSEIMLTYERIH